MARTSADRLEGSRQRWAQLRVRRAIHAYGHALRAQESNLANDRRLPGHVWVDLETDYVALVDWLVEDPSDPATEKSNARRADELEIGNVDRQHFDTGVQGAEM